MKKSSEIIDEDEWVPNSKRSSNQSSSKRPRKQKSGVQRKTKKAKKDSSSDEDGEQYDDMYILMKKLQELKDKKKREKEQKHQNYVNQIASQCMKSVQALIKKHKEADQERRDALILEQQKMFTEIQTEFKDWYSTFNSLHQAYLTDMAKLNRQYTRQCKRLDAIIAGNNTNDVSDSKEEAKVMETKLNNIMKILKRKIMDKDKGQSSREKSHSFEDL